MKIRVAFTVEVDADAWMGAEGLSMPSEVREDVRAFLMNKVIVPSTVVSSGRLRMKDWR